MIELFYKFKIIHLLETYGQWFHDKTDLYKKYFNIKDGRLELNYEEIAEINSNKDFYKNLKKELDYLAYK